MTMTIEDAQELEQELAEEIQALEEEFEMKTQTNVIDINVERLDLSVMGGPDRSELQEISVRTLL